MENDVSDGKECDSMTSEHSSKRGMANQDQDLLQTPVQTQQQLRQDGILLRSIDSGFSERSIFSSPDDTPSVEHVLSQEISQSSLPPVDLQDTIFSPVSHLPSQGRARRTSRFSMSSRPPKLQLVAYQDDTDGTTGNSENLAESSGEIKCFNSRLEEGSILPPTPLLLKRRRAVESSSSSSMSSSTDELEMSLQEMSLEESSSNSTSPVFGIPLTKYNIDKTLPDAYQDSSDESEHDCNENDLTILNDDEKLHDPEASGLTASSCEEMNSMSTKNKDEFLSIFSLTQKSDLGLETSGVKISSDKQNPDYFMSGLTSQTISKQKGDCLFNSRVPPLPHQYGALEHPSQNANCTSDLTKASSSLLVYHIPPACQELLKSPSKRYGTCPNTDQEFAFLRSPNKTRKTSLSSPVKSHLSTGRTPLRKLREKTSAGDKSSVVRSIFSDSVSDLRSPLVKRRESVASSSQSAITNVNSFNIRCINRDLESPKKSKKGCKYSTKKVAAKSPCSSPRKLFNQSPPSPSKQSSSPFSSPKKLISLSPFSSPKSNKNQFSSPTKFKIRSPYSSPFKSLVKSPQKSPRKLRLEKIIKEFSPKDPSRLIGRYTGAGKFDIIGELSNRAILHCLQQIFSLLSEADICSACQVTSVWRSAIFKDPLAIRRRKIFIKLQKKRIAVRGQENCQLKLFGQVTSRPMTVSKGHLTEVQPQVASMKTSLPTSPQKEKSSQRSLELLSSDRLRSCPQCQSPAKILERQDRALCSVCKFDFCILCFKIFHGVQRCKPLCVATSSKSDLAGSRKSRKNLRRL